MNFKWYHRVRLIRLADKLEGKGPYAAVGPVPPHKFDMRYIAQKHQGGREINHVSFDPEHCNTAACAIGWAKSDPWFKKDARLSFGLNFPEHLYLFESSKYTNEGGRLVPASVVAARLREIAASA